MPDNPDVINHPLREPGTIELVFRVNPFLNRWEVWSTYRAQWIRSVFLLRENPIDNFTTEVSFEDTWAEPTEDY